jgi:ATP-dependent DNA helicase RecQ
VPSKELHVEQGQPNFRRARQEFECDALYDRIARIVESSGLFANANADDFGGGVKGQSTINNGKILIFVATRAEAEYLAAGLAERAERAVGPVAFVSFSYMHGALTREEREERQRAFFSNSHAAGRGRWKCLVATQVVGAGVDEPHIRVVLHWGANNTTTFYQQEAGRAGRDGYRALALVYATPHSLEQLDMACKGQLDAQSREELGISLEGMAPQVNAQRTTRTPRQLNHVLCPRHASHDTNLSSP